MLNRLLFMVRWSSNPISVFGGGEILFFLLSCPNREVREALLLSSSSGAVMDYWGTTLLLDI